MKVNVKRSKQWVEVIREKKKLLIVCIAFVHDTYILYHIIQFISFFPNFLHFYVALVARYI